VLREGLWLIEEREAREAAKLKLLQEAAQVGFEDRDQGHYRDLRYDELEGFVLSLERRASSQIRSADR
jgi:antitoxin ParD1/3/4